MTLLLLNLFANLPIPPQRIEPTLGLSVKNLRNYQSQFVVLYHSNFILLLLLLLQPLIFVGLPYHGDNGPLPEVLGEVDIFFEHLVQDLLHNDSPLYLLVQNPVTFTHNSVLILLHRLLLFSKLVPLDEGRVEFKVLGLLKEMP